MIKKYIISSILLFLLLNLNITSLSIEKNNLYTNNINNEDIKIEVSDIKTVNQTINLDRVYDSYSIIQIEITNTGLDDIELSNINCFVYQGDKKLQTFVLSKDGCLGFIGTLGSGEKKNIKIGIILEEKNTSLKFVFEDLKSIKKEINV